MPKLRHAFREENKLWHMGVHEMWIQVRRRGIHTSNQDRPSLKTNKATHLTPFINCEESLGKKGSEADYLATVKIQFKPGLKKVVNKALQPEIESQFSDRTKVSMEKISDGLKMTFEASDIVALRAAVNSYLRWIHGILNLVEDIKVH